MKNLMRKNSFYLSIGAVATALILASTWLNQRVQNKQVSLHATNSGVGICFQRVTQTFTALMIRDFSSEYLTEGFKSATGECFDQVEKSLTGMGIAKSTFKNLSNLKSDLHWFNQKVNRVKSMAEKNEIDLLQSNITNKFSELESLKGKIEDGISKTMTDNSKHEVYGIFGVILSLAAFMLVGVAYGMNTKLRRKEFDRLEKKSAMKLVQEEVESVDNNYFDNVFAHFSLSETGNLFKKILENKNERIARLEDQLLKMNEIDAPVVELSVEDIIGEVEEEEEKLKTNFNMQFNKVVEKLNEKAFAKSVVLDTDIEEDIKVNSNHEALSQLLYTTFSLAMDKSSQDGFGRIKIKSKSLGGIAYCKVRISDYLFSDDELAIINGKISVNSSEYMNLILLKELVEEANASIAIQTKKNSSKAKAESEIELVFERTKEQKKSQVADGRLSIMKGSKKEIRKMLEARL